MEDSIPDLLLENELIKKIYQMLIEKHICVWGYGMQHALCDFSCHCICKSDRPKKECSCGCGHQYCSYSNLCDIPKPQPPAKPKEPSKIAPHYCCKKGFMEDPHDCEKPEREKCWRTESFSNCHCEHCEGRCDCPDKPFPSAPEDAVYGESTYERVRLLQEIANIGRNIEVDYKVPRKVLEKLVQLVAKRERLAQK